MSCSHYNYYLSLSLWMLYAVGYCSCLAIVASAFSTTTTTTTRRRTGTTTSTAFSSCTINLQATFQLRLIKEQKEQPLYSSFYNDFEDFGSGDDDDDDDDDDDYDLDDLDVAKFRSQMGNMFGSENEDEEDDDDEEDEEEDEDGVDMKGFKEKVEKEGSMSVDDLISFATSSGDKSGTGGSSSTGKAKSSEWAEEMDVSQAKELKPGMVLVANPAMFCKDVKNMASGGKLKTPDPSLLAKFGLTMPPPPEIGPDRRADLLPVLLLLECDESQGYQAVLLNRRTGYLLGDLEQPPPTDDNNNFPPSSSIAPKLGAFMIQPLWFGGTSASNNRGGVPNMGATAGGGLDMLHLCPGVNGASLLTDDGLYWGGDPEHAQEVMQEVTTDDGKIITGFDFKFFVQSTQWMPKQLEKEIKDQTWYVAKVSKEVLFKSRDRLGPKRAKPLWTNIMELLEGTYEEVRNQLYDIDVN